MIVRQDRPAQRVPVGAQFFRGELNAVALVEELRDLQLAVDRALAAHFGRVCRQDWTAQSRREELFKGRLSIGAQN